jgi:catechol 2,3-dioxygenase-like lactoylglutathione lyase family enzyme
LPTRDSAEIRATSIAGGITIPPAKPDKKAGASGRSSEMDFDFDHVHMVSKDVEAMVSYFERVFGGECVARGESRGAPAATVKLGSMRVLVRGIRPGENPDAAAPDRVQGLDHFGVSVPDVEAAAKWLKSRGAVFTVEPNRPRPNGRMIAFVRGPDNIDIEIVGPYDGP